MDELKGSNSKVEHKWTYFIVKRSAAKRFHPQRSFVKRFYPAKILLKIEGGSEWKASKTGSGQ